MNGMCFGSFLHRPLPEENNWQYDFDDVIFIPKRVRSRFKQLMDKKPVQKFTTMSSKTNLQAYIRDSYTNVYIYTSWWLNQPHLKNMIIKLDDFPK